MVHVKEKYHKVNYADSLGSIRPFWISWEPVMWPWCNLAASQRRCYWASMNTLPWGNDWPCVLCDHPLQNDRASGSASSKQCACPFYSSRVGFLWQSITSSRFVRPLQPRFGSLQLLAFPKAKIADEREGICECDGHTVHKVSQFQVLHVQNLSLLTTFFP